MCEESGVAPCVAVGLLSGIKGLSFALTLSGRQCGDVADGGEAMQGGIIAF